MNYEKDIAIDDSALDIEWLEQPLLMFKYAKLRADLILKVDRAKEHIDIVKAELDKEIRANPENYDMVKMTESSITNAILLQPEYTEAREKYLELKHDLDYAWAATSAIDARKTALENMVKLFGQQYFAGPKVPRDLTVQKQIRQEEANKGVAQRLKRRKKSTN